MDTLVYKGPFEELKENGLKFRSCLTVIWEFKYLFSTSQCNYSKPSCPKNDILVDNSGEKYIFSAN